MSVSSGEMSESEQQMDTRHIGFSASDSEVGRGTADLPSLQHLNTAQRPFYRAH